MQKSDGTTTVLTAFDQEAWNRSGVTWLASLRELAKYDGDVCVVNDGLNKQATKFLENNKVRLITPNRKFKDPNLDYFCTAMSAVSGTSAYWHNTSYFQSGIGDLMQTAVKHTVVSLGSPPLPMLRNSLEVFGYQDDDTQMPSAMYQSFLKIARRHGTVLQGRFIAGNKDRLSYLGKFVEFHVEHGYLNDSRHAVDLAINLFYSATPDDSFLVDNQWNELVDSRWIWRGKFYKDNDVVKVVSFHPDMVFSAVCARFHLVNCYRELHASWHAKYRDQLTMPRLLLKKMPPSKEKDDDQKQEVQVRSGE